MALLEIYAGPKAKRHITERGLSPADISTIFGASGAAKWLAIYGLDRAIFEQWLPAGTSGKSSETLDEKSAIKVYGTSVGAWKLAAACQRQPGEALEKLANAYINQSYAKKAKPEDVVYETERILQTFLPDAHIDQILTHPYLRYSCGAVKCRSFLGQERSWRLAAGMAEGFYRSLGRGGYGQMFERAVFSDPRNKPALQEEPGVRTQHISLGEDNLRAALRASAAIPYIMDPIREIEGAEPGLYRDGGLLDYHPIPQRFWQEPGLVLYPHFYNYLVPNWFDKFYASRKAKAEDLENVIMLSPSAEFIAQLPDGRLPDRKDFSIYKGRNDIRQARWRQAMTASLALGDAFLRWVNSADPSRDVLDFGEQ
ncbi:patatin-like phospholipase family protein [Pseudoteredinibacter isoporae]|uniref:patatin-like phospholipase family protein n=1 Tax=Pseudoteredinibacter isoporae TaxID=570281 RepID=UPI003105E485